MKILIYSQDTGGLGHIRRNLAVAENMASLGHDIIIVSDSIYLGKFDLPERVDFVRIPAVTQNGAHNPTHFTPSYILAIRQQILLGTVQAFKPSLFLADKTPPGLEDELKPTCDWIKDHLPRTKIILCLREDRYLFERTANDAPLTALHTKGTEYSEIWIFGNSVENDLNFESGDSEKIFFTGYVNKNRPDIELREIIRKNHKISSDEKMLLIVTGCGRYGHKIINTYLNIIEKNKFLNFKSFIVTGPFVEKNIYRNISNRSKKLNINILKFSKSIEELFVASDCVISMCGYSSTCEIISAARPTLIIPRNMPGNEQHARAKSLAESSLVKYIAWDEVSEQNMLQKIEILLEEGPSYASRLQSLQKSSRNKISQRIQCFENNNGSSLSNSIE